MTPASLKPHPPLPLYIDSSMLTAFRSCPRKYHWAYSQDIQPMGESIHLIAGKAFASGCEAARRAQHAAGRMLSAGEILEASFAPFLREWGEFEASPDDAKNFHNVWAAFEEYITVRYHPGTDEVQPAVLGGKLAVEYSFAIPLDILHPSGDPFIFCGKFDELGLWNSILPVLMDEKTTSMMGASWSRQWDLRGQFLGYCWAAQQLGYPISTVIVRGIAIQKTQHQFAQLPVQVPSYLIDRWHRELLKSIQRIIDLWSMDDWPYVFGDACSSYGGCAFMDLCKADDPSKWISNYEERTWSPIAKGEF